MEYKNVFAKALQQATSVVGLVRFQQLFNSTPCDKWNLRDLLHHMVYELLWAPEIIKGKGIKEVGDRFEGDLLGSDLQFAWKHAADAALVAVRSSKPSALVELSYGKVSAQRYITELAADLLIHAWDAGKALGFTLLFEPDLAKEIYKFSKSHAKEMAASKLFGTQLTVSASEALSVKLLGMYGRQAAWVAR